VDQLIKQAVRRGQKTLSEYDSKQVLGAVGLPITQEKLAQSQEEAVLAASEIGYPVVLKGCSDKATHKTEMGLVKLGLKDAAEVASAYAEIVDRAAGLDGVLVQEMVSGSREFVLGLTRDPQFGPCVMFGVGGVFTEAIRDVTFRVAPLTVEDAEEMLDEIRLAKLLDAFRGSPAVNRRALADALVEIGKLGCRLNEIAEIDINPVIIRGSQPVIVDALVVLNGRKP
jgi:acetyl-CoA synthetase (ADP-forming)